MRTSVVFFQVAALLVACFSSGLVTAASTNDPFSRPPDEVIVKFHPGTPAAAQRDAHQQANGRVVEQLSSVGVTVVEVGVGSVTGAIEVYERNPNVVYAEPNHHRLLFRPVTTEGSEPTLGVSNNFDEQWALANTGQGFGATVDPLFGTLIHPTYWGTAGADINAEAGWAGGRHGSPSVAIAVLDSGVDCNHSDLIGKCLEQLNFVAEHGSDNVDVIGHGTHVAGISAANTDNGIGIAGVGRDTSIGSMKVCWEDTSLAILGIVLAYCDDADIAEAINYAAGSGLYQVINMSLAGPEISITLQNEIDQAWDQGLVIVAGAGNEYTNTIMYPAGYSNVIAVGSTDQHDNLSYFSSFGSWVSVLAPGSAIFSTIPGEFCGQPSTESSDCYDWKSGTSMSTPHVAGLAALLWAHQPGATNTDIRNLIQTTASPTGVLGQNFQAWSEHGRIDMGAALSAFITELDPTSHHVDALVASTINMGRGSKQGQVQIRVRDDLGNPVPGAMVLGDFSGSFAEVATGVTDSSGETILTTTASAKGGVAFRFCVADVTAATAYDPSMNVVSCVDF